MSWIMMIVFLSFLTSMFISLVSNPMTMVIMVIIQSLLICILIFLSMSVSWYSYILFLIFMGGLMVVFIYVCSIASNEMFSSEVNITMVIIFMFSATFMTFSVNNMQMTSLDVSKMKAIFKMMETMNLLIVLATMFFLLFSLVVVVKISNMKMGPIRAAKK